MEDEVENTDNDEVEVVINENARITKKGYIIDKFTLTEQQKRRIKSDLTMSPETFGISFGAVTKFTTYYESSSKYFLPIRYGINTFGPVKPENNRLTSGKTVKYDCWVTLRDYQEKGFGEMIKALKSERKGGILSVGCAFGKTLCALKALHKVGKKAIVVVDRLNILNQWWEEIEKWSNAKVGVIQGKRCDTEGKDIVLAMVQTLSQRDFPPDTFDDFGIAIYDEIHCMAAETFSKCFPKVCAKYNIGLSATVERKDGLSKVFKNYIGGIFHEETMNVKNKKTIINMIKYNIEDQVGGLTNYIQNPYTKKANTSTMISNMGKNKLRTMLILKCIRRLARDPARQILVLSDRKQHLKDMHEYLQKKKVSCGLYIGNMSQSHLDLTCQKQVILGIYNLCQKAFNLKKLNTLVLATPRREVQQIEGRILRQQHRINPIIVDFSDWWCHTYQNQWRDRQKYFKYRKYHINTIEVKKRDDIKNLPALKTNYFEMAGSLQELVFEYMMTHDDIFGYGELHRAQQIMDSRGPRVVEEPPPVVLNAGSDDEDIDE
jgi:superfamily II DNA or RNA helicase